MLIRIYIKLLQPLAKLHNRLLVFVLLLKQVEISPGSNIFIDRLAWAVAQNANSASCFVRTLLTAVFPIGPFHMTSRNFRFNSKQCIVTSASTGERYRAFNMEFTQSLLHLPEIRLSDVQRIADELSLTKHSKLDKGYKFFIEQYLFDYEGKCFCIVHVSEGVRITVVVSFLFCK